MRTVLVPWDELLDLVVLARDARHLRRHPGTERSLEWHVPAGARPIR